VRPFARLEYRELRALQGISLDVHRGEFFGVVGRNGSGKSTLLKVLASIYRADAGRIRMAGRLAPFIELGVGFNPDLTARENVALNGVMMGLTRRDAESRLGAVLEFAELEEFEELPLKNYSSGMLVRLAFAVMVQADADIMLIDEVLAVGDASFAQKCADTFRQMRDAGKTIVLVTHDMLAVQEFCDRAMLIEQGEVRFAGDPGDVAQRYLKYNFDRAGEEPAPIAEGQTGEEDARLLSAWLEDSAGDRTTNIEHRQPIRFRAEVEGVRDVPHPGFGIAIKNADGLQICGIGTHLSADGREKERLEAGERAQLSATIENVLAPGRYTVQFWIVRNRKITDAVLSIPKLLDFVVHGPVWAPGIVMPRAEMEAESKGGSQ
jgi:ABC-type polysaccharide/polyol phosphate transport system ATPase subunit